MESNLNTQHQPPDVVATAPSFHNRSTSLFQYLRPHYVLSLLTLIYVTNYYDRIIFSIVLQSIKVELQLSDTILGLIGGFAFAMFYAILGLPIAYLADRINRRNVIAIGLFFWSVMTFLTGMAANAWQLALARFLLGAGEASNAGPSNSMLSDMYAKAKRPMALSILSSGATIGIILAYIVGGWINQNYGWRFVFFVAGIPGILLAVLFYLTVKEPVHGASEHEKKPDSAYTFWQTLVSLSSSRTFLYTAIGGSLMAVQIFAHLIWSPTFLIRVHDLSAAQAGSYIAFGRLAGVLGVIMGGILATNLARRNQRWEARIPALACMCVVPAEIIFLFGGSIWVSIGGLALASFFTGMHTGPLYAVIVNTARVGMRAMAVAFFLFISNFFGQTIGPLGIGYLNDKMLVAYGEMAIRYSLTVAVLFSLLAGGMIWIASLHLVTDERQAQ